jgi:hypothetical protein
VVLPVLVLVLAAVLWGVAASAAQLRCIDAARAGARAVARGDGVALGTAAARAAAPKGATVRVRRLGPLVEVLVSARVAATGRLLAGPLAQLSVSARASALAEDTPIGQAP